MWILGLKGLNGKSPHFRLTCVSQKTLLLKLPNGSNVDEMREQTI